MYLTGKSFGCFNALVLALLPAILLSGLFATPSAAQTCQLEVSIRDTVAYSGQANAVVSVYMENYADSVSGFEMWLILDRPDIMEFAMDTTIHVDTSYWRCLEWVVTTCVDSNDITDSVLFFGADYDWLLIDTSYSIHGAYDTSGTLISGWDYFAATSFGIGHDLKIVGMANDFAPPYTPGIGPQNGTAPLIKLYANIYEIPDEQVDRTVGIHIAADNLDNLSFSDPNGASIGIAYDTVIQERCYACEDGGDPPCEPMIRVPCGGPDVDSTWCCDTILSPRLDTDYVCIIDGALTVALPVACGDVDGSLTVNILDITALINYLYKEGDIPGDPRAADVDQNCAINILDITALITFLYKEGEPPACPMTWPCQN